MCVGVLLPFEYTGLVVSTLPTSCRHELSRHVVSGTSPLIMWPGVRSIHLPHLDDARILQVLVLAVELVPSLRLYGMGGGSHQRPLTLRSEHVAHAFCLPGGGDSTGGSMRHLGRMLDLPVCSRCALRRTRCSLCVWMSVAEMFLRFGEHRPRGRIESRAWHRFDRGLPCQVHATADLMESAIPATWG